jgi:cell division protein FtsW
MARARYGDAFLFVRKQLFRAAIGVVLMLLASQWDYRNYRRLAPIGLFLSGVLLLFLLGVSAIRGQRGWFHLLNMALQPVEFARVTLVVFLASEIARRGERMRSLRHGFLPLLGIVGIVLVLVLKQPDFGSAMALSLISLSLLYAGGVRFGHLAGSGVLLLAGACLMAMHHPHVAARVQGFLHPDAHASADAYQSLQSVLSIASGGPFGKGLGHGIAKYGYLPDPHTDFIFSILGEELGFVGSVAVLGLYLLLVARAIRVAKAHEDRFAELLALGIGLSLFWYVAVNIMVATRLFPVTGLPLPLLSYGGSSLVSHLFALGVLRNLARQVEPVRPRRTRWAAPLDYAVEAPL